MTISVVTCMSEIASAKRLGFPSYTKLKQDPRHTVIRWGNSSKLDHGGDYASVVNNRNAISLNVNKLEALRKIATATEIPAVFVDRANFDGKVLIRPLEHKGGENFNVIDGPCNIESGYYGTAWINTEIEYRVWFAWDHTLIARRVPFGKTKRDEEYPCRSNWGYKFREEWDRPGLRIRTLRAKKAIGLDCGAADVLVKNQKYLFLELNSAPTIDAKEIREFFQAAIRENDGD